MKLSIFWALVLALTSCVSVPDAHQNQSRQKPANRTLIGLNDPPSDFWTQWTPKPHSAGPELLFDHWVIDNPKHIETLWGALAAILDGMRQRAGSGPSWDTITMVLSTVEPHEANQVSVVFWIDPDATPVVEGMTFTFNGSANGLDSSAHVRLWRAEGDPSPKVAVIAESGAIEGPTQELVFLKTTTWESTLNQDRATPSDSEAELVLSLFWTPFIGSHYVAARRGRPAKYVGPSPLQDRQIFQVASDTVFPPRVDVDDLRLR